MVEKKYTTLHNRKNTTYFLPNCEQARNAYMLYDKLKNKVCLISNGMTTVVRWIPKEQRNYATYVVMNDAGNRGKVEDMSFLEFCKHYLNLKGL